MGFERAEAEKSVAPARSPAPAPTRIRRADAPASTDGSPLGRVRRGVAPADDSPTRIRRLPGPQQKVFHMDDSGVAHDTPGPKVFHMDESGVAHDSPGPKVFHMDDSGVAHDSPQPKALHIDQAGVAHDKPAGSTLNDMLTSWSTESIKAHLGGNTETAAANYNAAELLRRDFSANWFRAKDQLLKAHRGAKPSAQDEESMKANAIMQGLHGLRALDMRDTFEATRQEMKQMEPSIMLIEHLKQQRDKLKEAVEDPTSSLYAAGPQSDELLKARAELNRQRAALAAKKEEMLLKWGSAGSTTITSDIDSNPKGAFSVLTVRKFNEIFRRQGGGGPGWPFEPGTVYDINVYGQDYMGDWPPFDVRKEPPDERGGATWTMTPHQETAFGSATAAEFTRYQELMSYLHVLKYIDHGRALDHRIDAPETEGSSAEGPEWAAYKKRIIGSTPTDWQRTVLEVTIERAEEKYIEFRKRLLDAQRIVSGGTAAAPDALLTAMMAAPQPDTSAARSSASIDARLASRQPPGKISGSRHQSVQLGADTEMIGGLNAVPDEYDLGVVAMTASNRIYEQMEIDVIRAREAYASAKAQHAQGRADDDTVERAGLALKKAMIDALYFANEVYMTQGAVQFAVLYKQAVGKDARQARDLRGGSPIATSMNVPKEMFLHSFTENVGDTLKELNHYHGDDVAGALEKSAKYMDRMMESAENLLGPQFDSALEQWPELRTLRDVSAATAEIKANVDLRGAAELRKVNPATSPIEKVLAYMRLGESYESLEAALTAKDRETLVREEQAGKIDMAAVKANWASRSLAALDAVHADKRKTALAANTIANAQELRELVIDFGAEVPKMFHKWLEGSTPTFDRTAGQRAAERAAATRPSMDAEIGKLEDAYKQAKNAAAERATAVGDKRTV